MSHRLHAGWTLGPALALAIAAAGATSRGQEPTPDEPKSGEPAAVETPKSEPPRTDGPMRSFLGDPKRFTRLGGWGGMGGAMGQWGFGRSMLVMMPAVQEELELTDEQKQQLRDWSEQMRERGQEFARNMRRDAEAGNVEGGQRPRMGLGDVTTIFRMMDQVGTLLRENEAGVARILKASQRKRLDQIALQMEGITALARPEVAQKIHLNEAQYARIQEILAAARARQVGFWMEQAIAMRGARDRERGDGEAPPAPTAKGRGRRPARGQARDASSRPGAARKEAAKSDPNAEAGGEGDEAQAQAARRRQFQERFDVMRQGADAIQEQTVREILRVLVPKQRTAFDRLLGEPFDPSKLDRGLNFGPRGPAGDGTGRRGPEGESEDRARRGPGTGAGDGGAAAATSRPD